MKLSLPVQISPYQRTFHDFPTQFRCGSTSGSAFVKARCVDLSVLFSQLRMPKGIFFVACRLGTLVLVCLNTNTTCSIQFCLASASFLAIFCRWRVLACIARRDFVGFYSAPHLNHDRHERQQQHQSGAICASLATTLPSHQNGGVEGDLQAKQFFHVLSTRHQKFDLKFPKLSCL